MLIHVNEIGETPAFHIGPSKMIFGPHGEDLKGVMMPGDHEDRTGLFSKKTESSIIVPDSYKIENPAPIPTPTPAAQPVETPRNPVLPQVELPEVPEFMQGKQPSTGAAPMPQPATSPQPMPTPQPAVEPQSTGIPPQPQHVPPPQPMPQSGPSPQPQPMGAPRAPGPQPMPTPKPSQSPQPMGVSPQPQPGPEPQPEPSPHPTQTSSDGNSGKKKKKKKEKKNKFSKIDDEVSKDVDAAISNAVESGGDVSAAVKGATTQGEISRYHQHASTINKKLRKGFQESEVARAKKAAEAGETFKPGTFYDYANNDDNVINMLAGASNETADRVSDTLERMGQARKKNENLIKGYDAEIKKLDKAKQEMYDTAKLSTRQKFFIGARNLVDRATTLASHPMQTVKAMFSGKDAPVGDAIKERNERMAGRRQEALDKNVDKQYQKEYGDHDRHVRITRAALAERNRQINEVTGDAMTLYGSSDMDARSAARKNMTASTRKQLAEAAKKGSKGLGWKGKAGAAAALLGGLAVLGTMMGNHGEQSNAQLYNPGPQPQYAN